MVTSFTMIHPFLINYTGCCLRSFTFCKTKHSNYSQAFPRFAQTPTHGHWQLPRRLLNLAHPMKGLWILVTRRTFCMCHEGSMWSSS